MKRINHLHFGDSLILLKSVKYSKYPKTLLKKDFLEHLKKANIYSIYLKDVINSYEGRKKIIDLNKFQNDLKKSLFYKQKLLNTGYRGFSYEVDTSFCFSFELKQNITFKLALMAAKDLYYPPRLRRSLPLIKNSHISKHRYPAIAFCLGELIGSKIYIYVIQSDLAYRKPSYFRDNFRGWRKIIFEEIIDYAKLNGVKEINICPSRYLLDACHPNFSKPIETPETWKIIYDQTASDYSMSELELDGQVNIQAIDKLKKQLVKTMFNLKLSNYERV